jgi:hypothetical protein
MFQASFIAFFINSGHRLAVIFHSNLSFSVFRKTKSHLLRHIFIQVRDMKAMVPISAFWFWSIAFPAERQITARSGHSQSL